MMQKSLLRRVALAAISDMTDAEIAADPVRAMKIATAAARAVIDARQANPRRASRDE